jgi:hypothetical protein
MREILPAKAPGVSASELFATSDEIKEVNFNDKTVMEKVTLIVSLNEGEKNILYSMLDAFVGRRKLKDALSDVLHDVK